MSHVNGKHLSFPFRIERDGTTAQVSSFDKHIRDELIQLILTGPGERAFLPDFGGGARQLVFENSDSALSGMAKAVMTQAISRWLGSRISISDLKVRIENEKIDIHIKYKIHGEDDTREIQFQRKEG
jgi:Phage baseplate assembly protein W